MSFGFVDLIGIIKGFYIYIYKPLNKHSINNSYACIVDFHSVIWMTNNMHTVCDTSKLCTCYYCWHIFEFNKALNLLSLCAILWILLLMQFQNYLFVHSYYYFCMMVLLSKLCTAHDWTPKKKFHNAPLHETLKGYSGYTYEQIWGAKIKFSILVRSIMKNIYTLTHRTNKSNSNVWHLKTWFYQFQHHNRYVMKRKPIKAEMMNV